MYETMHHFFSDNGFMPHGMCYLWQPDVLALHIISDALITLAYFSIPFTLLYFVRRRKDLQFSWMFVSFAVFIVACGTTHLMEIWVIWHPTYWLSGSIKAVTALASVPTAILLAKLIPDALRLPSPSMMLATNNRLEQEVAERKRAQQDVERLNNELEQRVIERTHQLEQANQTLIQEISERRRIEQSLRESEQLVRAILDNATAVVYVKDVDGRYLLINRRYEEVFSLSGQQVIGKTDHDIFPRAHADAFRAADTRVMRNGIAEQLEEVAPHHDGPHTYVSVKCPLHDATGKLYAMCGISTDITDRIESERRQQIQLNQISLLNRITRAIAERQDLASMLQAVIRQLENDLPIDFGCICFYEAAAEVLTVSRVGLKSRLLATDVALLEHSEIPVEENGLSKCIHGQQVYESELENSPHAFPRQLLRGGLHSLIACPLMVDGKVFAVMFVARRAASAFSPGECEFLGQLSEHVALAANQIQIYAALQQAYDDLHQTQQTAMQQERLRVLGQMASGIAHDINNAISPVSLYTESLLEHETGLSEAGRNQITVIQRAIEDVAGTVSRMRDFYRLREPQSIIPGINLNQIAEQAVQLTRARWRDIPQQHGIHIELYTTLQSDLPTVDGAKNEICDALTNLVINAVDAMPNGGIIHVRTRTIAAQSDNIIVRRVCVEVSDTGAGMDEETRRRCLEPFFTTKGERGTGLGLAMVYGMTQRHGANLEIDSEPGRGTTVRLIFTVSTAAVKPPSVSTVPATPAALHILVVDDDPLVLQSISDILRHDGHSITTASGGQAGIDTFTSHTQAGTPFDLVLTDLGMPYVDGRKVSAAVRALSPRTPIILITGWGQQMGNDSGIANLVDRVLSKPPKLHELRNALTELASRKR